MICQEIKKRKETAKQFHPYNTARSDILVIGVHTIPRAQYHGDAGFRYFYQYISIYSIALVVLVTIT
jgi:hypothetical protein